jgi:hypothetical protein
MNFESLIMVCDVPERLDILKYGERKKMSLMDFVDYIGNYVLVINEKTGKDIFSLVNSYTSCLPYVRYNYKNKIKTSDIYSGNEQLSPSESIPTEPVIESNGDNPGPTGIKEDDRSQVGC